MNSNRAAVNMVQEKPLFGFGWDRFKDDSLPYYRQSPDYPLSQVDRVHHVVLANMVDLGLIGTSLWLLAVFLAIGGAMRRRPAPPDVVLWRNGLVAFAACFFVVSNFTPLYYAVDNYMIWLWAGVVTAGTAGFANQRRLPERARVRPVREDVPARVGA
ncbi:MAG: hypothetical protein AVDCRST_MAG69-147 [uncultured Solirubrobacteraceae bacterium]|uniref:O-antigen polymerase n=1 Tax=uncultured Solirubrobacteraceae bacterium TaxID=1162706 RepID=A0A6J4RIB4_9ACTN|nr:MAG: hypothetical protein AVDCRST_MAG69-147 [uncultured Solirubrobacteraceae bacterium]